MLSAEHRLRSSREFRSTSRRGSRTAARTVVVHGRRNGDGPVKVGFVVSRQVAGTAVARNRIKRRLRHLFAARLESVPSSTSLVVRARPAAVHASSAVLGADIDRALSGLLPELAEGVTP